MSSWDTSAEAASRVESWAAAGNHFFTTTDWGEVLRGLGAEPRFAWSESLGRGLLVPVFRRGPLRAGLLGFPVGDDAFQGEAIGEGKGAAIELGKSLRLDVLRSNVSERTDVVSDAICQPDIWLDQLPNWRSHANKRLVRDLAYARRASREVEISTSPPDPRAFHAIYANTVRFHGGRARYGLEYFARLFAAVERTPALAVVHAKARSGQLLGASVLAMDGATGYYLHSSLLPEAKPMGVSDLLLERLLDTALERGMTRFNFMASPATQVGLVRYKRKWGDREAIVATRDYGVGPLGRMAVAVLALLTRQRSSGA